MLRMNMTKPGMDMAQLVMSVDMLGMSAVSLRCAAKLAMSVGLS
jgi:hypothetical protein